MEASAQDPWEGLTPTEAAALLAASDATWWFAGGWAMELFAPTSARQHGDLDIGCYRECIETLRQSLPRWEWFSAAAGRLVFLEPGQLVREETTSLWCRRPAARTWAFQLMIEASNGGKWLFRRDPTIRRWISEMTWKAPHGFLVLRPEVQLLYKANSPRAIDYADFTAALPYLSRSSREWLTDTVSTLYPEHPWLTALTEYAAPFSDAPQTRP